MIKQFKKIIYVSFLNKNSFFCKQKRKQGTFMSFIGCYLGCAMSTIYNKSNQLKIHSSQLKYTHCFPYWFYNFIFPQMISDSAVLQ